MTKYRRDQLIQDMNDGFDSLDAVELSIEIEDEILSHDGIDENVADVLRHAKARSEDEFSGFMADMNPKACRIIEAWNKEQTSARS